MKFYLDKNFSIQLDQKDPLKKFREKFFIPKQNGKEVIYFCGNSLGLQPKQTPKIMAECLEDWQKLGVRGHFEGTYPWYSFHERFSKSLATLAGAKPSEVVAMNSLTVDLHLMMVSFYRPTKKRYKIVIEKNAFPSDRYAVISQIKFHGFSHPEALVELHQKEISSFLKREGKKVALLLLPSVQYLTGEVFDIQALTRLGHRFGCTMGFDLAHAIGNIPLKLHEWNVDFAVWCSYKYLNGGPGAVGGCFVHERHGKNFKLPRFVGWWGHNKKRRFLMESEFQVMKGAEGWQVSNPPIFSLAPLLSSLEIFKEAGKENIFKKSKQLTNYLEFLIHKKLKGKVEILTPLALRGAQLSLRVCGGKKVWQRLKDQGIAADWREPDVLRVAPVPLYNRFEEVFRFVELLIFPPPL